MATSARLDELKKKFDESPRRYFAPLANEFRKLGDLTQAVAICRAHLPNQPGHVSGHIVLAQALYESKELGEARVAFEQALDLDPENLIALRYLGDIAREQDAPEIARAWYERVLDADPRNDEIASLLSALPVEQDASRIADTSNSTAPTVPTSTFEATSAVEDFAVEGTGRSAFGEADELSPVEDAPAARWETPISSPFDAIVSSAPAFPPPPELTFNDDIEGATEENFVAFADEAVTAHDEVDSIAGHAITVPDIAVIVPHDVVRNSSADDPFSEAFADADARRDEVISLSDLEAIAEPHNDDWFGSSEDDRLSPATVSPETEFFPDLSALTPPSSLSVPQSAAVPSLELSDFSLVQQKTPPRGSEATHHTLSDALLHFDPSVEDFADEETVAVEFATEDRTLQADTLAVSAAEESVEEELAVAAVDAVDLAPADRNDGMPVWMHDLTTPAEADDFLSADESRGSTAEVTSDIENNTELSGASPDFASHELESRATPSILTPAISPWEVTPAPDAFAAVNPVADSQAPVDPSAMEAPEQSVHDLSDWDASLAEARLTPPLGEPAVEDVESVAADDCEAHEADPDAFVTETMAELYLQQGFVEEALGIYRKLLARDESNANVRARVETLVAGQFTSAAKVPSVERSGQSARTFFGQFARREVRRGFAGESHLPLDNAGTAETIAAPGADAVVSTYSGVATREEAMTVPDDESAIVTSSLEELFGSRPQSPDDVSAADTLAAAFSAEQPDQAAIDGRGEELSLQHLFRDVPAKSASAVSLDEFFATDRDNSSVPNETPAGEQRADIEQFTAWLEGLKKK